MDNTFALTGRVALVTGGGRGIGLAIAHMLAAQGCDIAIADLIAESTVTATAELAQYGVKTHAIHADVRISADCDRMVQETVNALGKVDILIANAGIADNSPAEAISDDDWLDVINTNLNGLFYSCRAAGRHMIERQSGVIVNVASMSGSAVNKPQPQAAYNASKAAVIQLTKSLAMEWVEHSIRVNCVSPGYIGTPMTIMGTEKWGETWNEMTPMKRLGTPEEVAQAVLYLASDASSFATGTDLIIDGGYTSW